jgi:hypothetical protein
MTRLTDCEPIWERYRASGSAGLRGAAPLSARAALYAALLAHGGGDRATASEHAARATEMAPDSLLAQEICRYLLRTEQDVALYAGGEAFAAFIRGGGNRRLYECLAEAMRRHYRHHDKIRLLDIGVGDGLALLGVVDERPIHADLVEPSAPMLARVTAELIRRGVPHAAYNITFDAFTKNAQGHWDIGQATFSLQCLEPPQRAAGLGWLRQHCDELLIAEFDTAVFPEKHGPARAALLIERYERGIAEYTDARTLVAQGFLVPILTSLFSGDANQNFEQPIAGWVASCHEAGFSDVRTEHLCSY